MKKSFGKTLRDLRLQQNLGLRIVADELGLSPSYISRIEQDKEPPPRTEVIRKMADLLNGTDVLFDLANTSPPDLVQSLEKRPDIRELIRTITFAKCSRDDVREITASLRLKLRQQHSQQGQTRKENSMPRYQNWAEIWPQICQNLINLPKCPRHPEHPHVQSMVQGVINDILAVDHTGINLRSHRTNNVDPIPAMRFKTWWEHLINHGSASLVPGGENNPHPWRSRIVGAIIAAALPKYIDIESPNSIVLRS